jgi:hypothetical protein
MNSTNHSPQERSAYDALFDQVERDLVALTTAPLELGDGAPRICVDEFANEFLSHWSMPPKRHCRR